MSDFKEITEFISNSYIISKYFRPIPYGSINMKVIQTSSVIDISKSLENAFSYIDDFEMEIDSTYLYPDSMIGIKLLLVDRCIFNIFQKLRTETQTKFNIHLDEVIFHITLAKCFKKVSVEDTNDFNEEFYKLCSIVNKITYINFNKPSICF
jgi:hypothetical protein